MAPSLLHRPLATLWHLQLDDSTRSARHRNRRTTEPLLNRRVEVESDRPTSALGCYASKLHFRFGHVATHLAKNATKIKPQSKGRNRMPRFPKCSHGRGSTDEGNLRIDFSTLPALNPINPLRNRRHLSPWVSASPLYLSKWSLDASCKS